MNVGQRQEGGNAAASFYTDLQQQGELLANSTNNPMGLPAYELLNIREASRLVGAGRLPGEIVAGGKRSLALAALWWLRELSTASPLQGNYSSTV
jgi:hypothetical protein